MKKEDILRKLTLLNIEPNQITFSKNKLLIMNYSLWSIKEIDSIARVLGTEAIDSELDGCSSCGFGATIIIYDIVDDE